MLKKRCKQVLIILGLYPVFKTLKQVVIFLLEKMNKVKYLMKRKSVIDNYLSKNEVPKLNIGCGLNIIKGWLNADIAPLNSEVIFLNATKVFPFKDETFDYIFTEHMIEHISYKDGIFMINECYRILKPGGKLRIATPDLRFLIELYNEQKNPVQEQYIKWVMNKYFPEINSNLVSLVLNNFFYNFGHRFVYDFKTMKSLLENTGFMNITKFKVGTSSNPLLQGLEGHHNEIPKEFNELETFVVETQK